MLYRWLLAFRVWCCGFSIQASNIYDTSKALKKSQIAPKKALNEDRAAGKVCGQNKSLPSGSERRQRQQSAAVLQLKPRVSASWR
jgi:hypothetical protein